MKKKNNYKRENVQGLQWKSSYSIVSVLPWYALLQRVLLLLLLLLLYHGVLLIQQLPDLVVVVTQAAFQANAPGLRLDKEHRDAKGHVGPYITLIYNFVQHGFTFKHTVLYTLCTAHWRPLKIKVLPVCSHRRVTDLGFKCLMKHSTSTFPHFNNAHSAHTRTLLTVSVLFDFIFWVASILSSCQLCILLLVSWLSS